MKTEFKQVAVDLSHTNSSGILSAKKLLTLIEYHPYKDDILGAIKFDSIHDDHISIKNVDSAFSNVKSANEKFKKFNVLAETKDITVETVYEEGRPTVQVFFEECRIDDELKEAITAEAIYNAKNTFFEEFSMSKYANFLNEKGFNKLVSENIAFFKRLAEKDKKLNKTRSYRLLSEGDKLFLRGITSDRYNEYGIDFTFFIALVLLHQKMKQNKGNNYEIVALYLSESKLDMIIKDTRINKIDHFGNVTLAINVSTNELGDGSLSFTSMIRVENSNNKTMLYLVPRDNKDKFEIKQSVNHITALSRLFEKLANIEQLFNASEEFMKDIASIQTIKTPDELRHKIQMKVEQPNSVFKEVKELRDIFKPIIKNEINQFSKLLEMCRKAEELNLDYDVKDKLRYIISDIILNGHAK